MNVSIQDFIFALKIIDYRLRCLEDNFGINAAEELPGLICDLKDQLYKETT